MLKDMGMLTTERYEFKEQNGTITVRAEDDDPQMSAANNFYLKIKISREILEKKHQMKLAEIVEQD